MGVTITVTDVDEPPDTPSTPDGDCGLEHEPAGDMGCAGEHRPAHHRLRLPATAEPSRSLDGGHEHDDSRGRRSRFSGLTAEHLLRCAGSGDERGGHERLVEFRVTEVDQRSQARTSRPYSREGTSATRSVSASASSGTSIAQPVTATDFRFGRHADLHPRGHPRGDVRHPTYDGAAHHESRGDADNRDHVRDHGCRQRRHGQREGCGDDNRYRCAAEQPARI